MSNLEKICTIAEAGFREVADRAIRLRDELREAGAPQDVISRVDRILYTAQIGESNALANLQPAGAAVGASLSNPGMTGARASGLPAGSALSSP